MKDRIFPQSDTGLPWTESFPVHLVHFYDDGAFPDRSIADFLWTGLQTDESAVIIATSEHMRALRECLTTHGAALHALERSGRLTALDAHVTLEQLRGEGLPDRARLLSILSPTFDQAAAAAPNRRWRMFGEMTALLAEEGNIGGSVELERLWNELFSTRSFRLYCAYPIRQFAHESLAEPFSQMCGEHDEVVPVLTWLDKPERHGRWLAVLQQRARALQVEINERKQTEEALRQAEAKYRGIFENAVEGIFQSTPSGNFITANPALAHMLGYKSPAELMATITDIQAQLYVEPERRSEFTRLLEENDRQRFEVELYRKDGSTVWVSINVRAVRDNSGQVLYYEGMAEDITERMRAEEELQRRADEFAALYDTAHDLATQQDFSTLVQAIVERALSLLNLPAGGISLYDPTRGDLEVVFAKEGVVPLGTRVPFGEGITGRVAQSRQPLIINDFPTWKPGSPWLAGKGIKSLISVPMLSGGELIGVLSVGEHKTERKFTDADARLLSLFAAQAASAIRNAHLLEETRKRAEQLAISEEQTRLIVDSAYDAFIAIDANGLITAWNHQAEVTFGWSREEIMGRLLSETIIPTQHQEAYKRGLERFLATGKGPVLNRRIEVTALHRDGHEFPVELTITPIRWGDSYIFSAFVHDITERKRAEEALRRSEAYLAEAQRLSHTGSWAWNVATREFVHWSQEHYRMYGLDPKRGIPTWEAAQQLIHPEDRARCFESIDRAIRERTDCILDYRAVLPDGTIKYIHSIGRPVFNASGDLVEFVGTEMDVTERKRVEAHQAVQYAVTRVLAESASLAEATPQLLQVICESLGWEVGEFWSADSNAHLIRWVAAWHAPSLDIPEFIAVSRQSAYAAGVDLPGRVWQSGQPAWIPNVATNTNFSRAAIAAQAGLRSACAFPILLGSQTLGAMIFLSREIRPPDEGLLKVMSAIGSQVGQFFERKRAEEALRRAHDELEIKVAERTAELAVAKERAEEADRLKSAFLATMSHELRSPLNSIIGFTGIMLQGLVGPLNKEQKKQLNIVKNSAHHLLNLINEVLDLSRIEAGQMELHLESFDMRTLIDKTVQTLKPLAEKKKLQLIGEVRPEVDRVVSDPHRVEQILINLVNNAIKFTEKGEVRIECRVRDGWLLTSVADTGIGIKPEDLAKLFTTFRQLDSTLARKHEGTGLGLAICQKLADLLGGEIRVESEWGVGSNFTFVLPLNR